MRLFLRRGHIEDDWCQNFTTENGLHVQCTFRPVYKYPNPNR